MPRQPDQFFGLGCRGGHGLFHNDMLAGIQCNAGIPHMLQIRHRDIHRVHPLEQFQKIGGTLRHAVFFAQLLRKRCAAGRRADSLHRKRRVFHKPRQKFLHDLARAKNA